jgi:sec-independent protein translocase protein TatB
MFDVGFSELVLLFIIGLLILGPERLPRVATQIGRWVGRARRTATQLRHQLEREMAMADIRKPPPQDPKPESKEPPAASEEEQGASQESAVDEEAQDDIGANLSAEDREQPASDEDKGRKADSDRGHG